MACVPLIQLTLACGPEGRVAGLETAYMISYADLAPVSGIAGDPKVTYSTGGIINEIGLAAGKKFVEIQFSRSNAGLTDKLTKNIQNGTAYFTPEFSLTLADLSTENRNFVLSVMNQPVALIAKSRSGRWLFTGGNGQFELATSESGTGTAEGDLLGYKLTFTGVETKPLPEVDSTIIADLIA